MRLATPSNRARPQPHEPVGLEARQYHADASVGIMAKSASAATIGKITLICAPIFDKRPSSAAPAWRFQSNLTRLHRRLAAAAGRGRLCVAQIDCIDSHSMVFAVLGALD